MGGVLHILPSGDRGDMARHVRDLALGLKDSVAGVATGSPGWLAETLRAGGVEVYSAPHLLPFKDMRDAHAARAEVLDLCIVKQPDFMHAHGPAALSAALLAAKEVPLVYTPHGLALSDPFQSKWLPGQAFGLQRMALSRVSAVVTLTAYEESDALQTGFQNVQTIAPGVARPKVMGGEDRGRVVGTASELVRGRGLEDLVEAVARLPRSTLLVVGEGPLEAELIARADAEGIRDRVVFLGWVDDIAYFHERIAVYASLSPRPGAPYGALDAIASGLPAVLSDVPGHRKLVRNGVSGALVPPGDPAHAAKAIDQILRDRTRALMAQEAALVVSRPFDLETMLARHRDIYDEITARRQEQTPKFQRWPGARADR